VVVVAHGGRRGGRGRRPGWWSSAGAGPWSAGRWSPGGCSAGWCRRGPRGRGGGAGVATVEVVVLGCRTVVRGVPRLPDPAAAAAVVVAGTAARRRRRAAPGPPKAWSVSTTTIPAVARPVASHGRRSSPLRHPVDSRPTVSRPATLPVRGPGKAAEAPARPGRPAGPRGGASRSAGRVPVGGVGGVPGGSGGVRPAPGEVCPGVGQAAPVGGVLPELLAQLLDQGRGRGWPRSRGRPGAGTGDGQGAGQGRVGAGRVEVPVGQLALELLGGRLARGGGGGAGGQLPDGEAGGELELQDGAAVEAGEVGGVVDGVAAAGGAGPPPPAWVAQLRHRGHRVGRPTGRLQPARGAGRRRRGPWR
jgi:hypothetical protein